MPGNNKDFVLTFRGVNLAGPVIQGLQKQLNDLDAMRRKSGGFADTKGFVSVGAALNAEIKKNDAERFKMIRDSEQRALKIKRHNLDEERKIHEERFKMIRDSELKAS